MGTQRVERAGELDRATCQAYTHARFSAAAMTDAYEEVYAMLAQTLVER